MSEYSYDEGNVASQLLDQWNETDNPDTALDARRQEAILVLGRRAIAPPEVSGLLHSAAILVAETLDVKGYGITELSPGGETIRFRLGDRESGETEHTLSVVPSHSLMGFALSKKKPVRVDDLSDEDRFRDLLLQRKGVRAAIACPLRYKTHEFGVLAVYSMGERKFSDNDLTFIETIADVITGALSRQYSEQAMAEKASFTDTVLETLASPVFVLSPKGVIREVNRAAEKMSGVEAGNLVDQNFWTSVIDPSSVDATRQALSVLTHGESCVRVESKMIVKSGKARHISWSFSAVRDSTGQMDSILGTGIDLTEHRQALDRLARSEASAKSMRQSLTKLRERIESRELVFDRKGKAHVANLPEGVENNRRDKKRRLYPYVQFIAPWNSSKTPPKEHFFEVRCHDITSGGFSFLTPAPLNFKKLVVGFGRPPAHVYLEAEIRHVTPFCHDGFDMYLTGCEYVGRPEGVCVE